MILHEIFENLNDYEKYIAWFLGTLTHIKSQEKCRTRMMKLSLSLSLRCALRMQLCYIRWFATHAGGHSLFFVFLYLKYLGKIYFNPNRAMYLHKTSLYSTLYFCVISVKMFDNDSIKSWYVIVYLIQILWLLKFDPILLF